MRVIIGAVATAFVMAATTASAADLSQKAADRIKEAVTVLQEIHAVPDKDIPQELWEKAECVIVIPNLKKAAFIIGGEFGKGLMSCREKGNWSAPVFMELQKGSWGLQVGAESIDLVLLVMNRDGVKDLLDNEFKFGANASVAAGPVGRQGEASTDASLNAQILAYSRAKGLFAGLSLEGASLRVDKDANKDFYGTTISTEDMVRGITKTTPAGSQWTATLTRLVPASSTR